MVAARGAARRQSVDLLSENAVAQGMVLVSPVGGVALACGPALG